MLGTLENQRVWAWDFQGLWGKFLEKLGSGSERGEGWAAEPSLSQGSKAIVSFPAAACQIGSLEVSKRAKNLKFETWTPGSLGEERTGGSNFMATEMGAQTLGSWGKKWVEGPGL